jgi:hypothetical protein
MTPAFFHALGYVDVLRKQLIISVRGPRITGNESLMTHILILSRPGDLLEGIDIIMFCTSACAGNKTEIEQFVRGISRWCGWKTSSGNVNVIFQS